MPGCLGLGKMPALEMQFSMNQNNFQEKTIKQQQTTGAKSNLKSAIHAILK